MRKNSSSSLFLMELILAILFFSLASTVCIKLFVQSHLLSKDSVNLNHGILWCQNLAETYDGFNGDISQFVKVFPTISQNDDCTYSIYFDDNWDVLNDSTDAIYCANISQVDSSPLLYSHIYCYEISSGKVIYEINIKKYVPEEVKQ